MFVCSFRSCVPKNIIEWVLLLQQEVEFLEININIEVIYLWEMSKKKLGGTGGGFISFSDVSYDDDQASQSKSRYVTSSDSKMSVAYTGQDPILAVASKRLLKKDVNTKLKSITEIIQALSASKDGDERVIGDFMPFFTFAFSKLLFDDTIQIRMGLANILSIVCEINRKALAPVLDDLIGGWWQMMSDTSIEVKNNFRSCFQTAFPPKRRQMVTNHLSKRIFEHCAKNLAMTPSELKALTLCSDEDLQEKYDRVIISSFGGITDLLDQLDVSELETRLFDEDNRTTRMETIEEIIKTHVQSKSMEVKNSLSFMITSLMEKLPDSLQNSIDILRTFCLENLDDSSATLDSTFQLIISLANKWPSFYENGGFLVTLLQKITSLFRSHVSGVHDKVLEFLLPFAGSVSCSKLGVHSDSLTTLESQHQKKPSKLMKMLLSILSDEVACNIRSVNGLMTKATYLQRQTRVIECSVFLLLRKPSNFSNQTSSASNQVEVNMEFLQELLSIICGVLTNTIDALTTQETHWRRAGSQDIDSVHVSTDNLMKTMLVLHRATLQHQLMQPSQWNELLWQVLATQLISLEMTNETATSSTASPFAKFAEITRNFILSASDSSTVIFAFSKEMGLFFTLEQVFHSLLLGSANSTNLNRLHLIQHAISGLELLLSGAFSKEVHGLFLSILDELKPQWLFFLIEMSTVTSNMSEESLPLLWSIFGKDNKDSFSMHKYILISSEDLLSCALKLGNAAALLMSMSSIIASHSSELLLQKYCSLLLLLPPLLFTLGTSDEDNILNPVNMDLLGVRLINDLRLSSVEVKVALLSVIWQLQQLPEYSTFISDDKIQEENVWVLANKYWQQDKCSKMCLWFVLSVIVKELSDKNNISEQILLLLAEETFANRITSLLLSSSNYFTPASVNKQKYHFEDIITNVDDVYGRLFPLLSYQVLSSIQNQYLNELDTEFEQLITPPLKFEDYHQKKWTQQLANYLTFCHLPQLVSQSTEISEKIPSLLRSSFWCQTESNDVKIVVFSLWVAFLKIFSSTMVQEWSTASSWLSAPLIVKVLCSVFEFQPNLITVSYNWINATSLREIVFETSMQLLTRYSELCSGVKTYLLQEHTLRPHNATFEARALNALFSYVTSNVSTISTSSLHLALDAIRWIKGTKVWYLKIAAAESTSRLSLQEAVITGVHLENGPEHPYYSISLLPTEENGFQHRELQTEWWRLLVSSDNISAEFVYRDTVESDLWSTLLTSIQQVKERYGHHTLLLEKSLTLLVQEMQQNAANAINYLQSSFMTQLKSVSSIKGSTNAEKDQVEETIDNLLLLLPFLLKFNVSSDANLLWLQEIIEWLYLELISPSKAMRLAHDAKLLISRIRVIAGLLSNVTASCVLETIAEKKLLPMAWTMLSTEVHASQSPSLMQEKEVLRNVVSHLLSILWQRQGAQRVAAVEGLTGVKNLSGMSDYIASLFPIRSWEIDFFAMLIRRIFVSSDPQTNEQESDFWTMGTDLFAVEGALLGRNRREVLQLIAPFVQEPMWAHLWQEIAFSAVNASPVKEDESLLTSSKRLLAGKLLDIFVAHEDTTRLAWQRVSSLLMNNGLAADETKTGTETNAMDESTNEEDDSEMTEVELRQRDARILQTLLSFASTEVSHSTTSETTQQEDGLLWMQTLHSRFDSGEVLHRGYQFLQDAAMTEKEVNEREEQPDDYDDNEDDNNNDTETGNGSDSDNEASVSAQKTSQPNSPKPQTPKIKGSVSPHPQHHHHHHQHHHQHKRLRRYSLLHHDPLGSLMAWLITLQAIDSTAMVGPARNSLRAQCGTMLQKSGYFAEVMSLLLGLAGDALTKATNSTVNTLVLQGSSHAFQRLMHLLPQQQQQQRDTPSSLSTTTTPTVSTLYHSHLQALYALSAQATLYSHSEINQEEVFAQEMKLRSLAIYALYRTILTLPAMTRVYWSSDQCRRGDKSRLSKFVEEKVRGLIIRKEIALIDVSGHGRTSNTAVVGGVEDPEDSTLTTATATSGDNFCVQGNVKTGQITASLVQDEVAIDITITLPPSYPLKNVDVSCTRRIGVTEARWRRWVLQMIQLLSLQDGAVIDATLLWRSNITQELQGIEPCPICYCTLHTKTLKLPTFACPTCKHRFHPSCLHTWFKTSGKNKCVLCQQPISL